MILIDGLGKTTQRKNLNAWDVYRIAERYKFNFQELIRNTKWSIETKVELKNKRWVSIYWTYTLLIISVRFSQVQGRNRRTHRRSYNQKMLNNAGVFQFTPYFLVHCLFVFVVVFFNSFFVMFVVHFLNFFSVYFSCIFFLLFLVYFKSVFHFAVVVYRSGGSVRKNINLNEIQTTRE